MNANRYLSEFVKESKVSYFLKKVQHVMSWFIECYYKETEAL
jgi:hypothetical protein